jgi:hypothetical protein
MIPNVSEELHVGVAGLTSIVGIMIITLQMDGTYRHENRWNTRKVLRNSWYGILEVLLILEKKLKYSPHSTGPAQQWSKRITPYTTTSICIPSQQQFSFSAAFALHVDWNIGCLCFLQPNRTGKQGTNFVFMRESSTGHLFWLYVWPTQNSQFEKLWLWIRLGLQRTLHQKQFKRLVALS